MFWKERKLEMFENKTQNQLDIWNEKNVGKEAFTSLNKDGYLCGVLNGKIRLAHRILWQIVNDEIPFIIDHINGVRNDNRLINLRNVNHIENNRNLSILPSNKSGVTGVYFRTCRNKWLAKISVNNKQIHLGYYENFEDAIKARKEGEIKYGFHENHGKKRLYINKF